MPDARTVEMAVFVRKAREAAHQCLFFLRLLQNQRAMHWSPEELQGGVAAEPPSFVDRVVTRFGWELSFEARTAYRTFARDQMRVIVGVVRSPIGYESDAIIQQWTDVCGRLDAPTFLYADLVALVDSLRRFLDVSGPANWIERLDSAVRRILVAIRGNLALLIASIGVWAVFFRVEAVHSLVWNAGFWRVSQSWSPLLVGIMVPIIRDRLTRERLASKWRSARANFLYQARPPESGIARWPPGPRLVEQAIFSRQLVKLSIVLTFVAAVGLYMLVRGVPTTLTIFLTAAICLVVLLGAHGLDYWDSIDAAPIRFLALVSLLILVLFETESSLYRFIIVLGTGGFGARVIVRYSRSSVRTPAQLLLGILLGIIAIVVGFDLVSPTLAFLASMVAVSIWRSWVLLEPGRRTVSNFALLALSLYCVLYPVQTAIQEYRGLWQENAQIAPRIEPGKWPLAGDNGPIVIMAASGGGSRAAIYTAFTLERLVRDEPDVANHLQAISSVSGGSLAAAAYVARRYNWGKRFGEWASALPNGVERGELVDAVSDDFLLPTLWGALWPFSTRGESIEARWKDGPAKLRDLGEKDGELSIEDLVVAWDDAQRAHAPLPPFPVPLFNTCTLDQHDVVISPLSAAYYTQSAPPDPDQLAAAADLGTDDWLTWVAARDTIYGLEALLPKYDVSLPKAVRASANFPFGFPLVALRTQPARNWFQDPHLIPKADVKLTDGGVLSNSGLWPLWPLLTNPAVTDELQRRGVLLIIVEASKMPEYSADRRDITTLYGDINNRNPVAQALHRRIIEGLRARLGGAIAIEQVDVTPRAGIKSANIMTTWALDPPSQENLAESFRFAWKREQKRIHVAWGCLHQPGTAKSECLRAAADSTHDQVALRPPLD